MNHATGLDHIGIVCRDLDATAQTFEAAGFVVTPLAAHEGGRTGNRCVMFRDGGYIELVSTLPGGTSATLDRFLARHEGAHILALTIDDPEAVAERLNRAGITSNASRSERPVDSAGPIARFTLLTPPDRPEGRVHLIRHETPGALWQDRFLHHPNGATALAEVVLTVAEPAQTAAWYSRLAGRSVVPDPSGGYCLPLPRGRLRIVPARPTAPAFATIGLAGGSGPPLIVGGTSIEWVGGL